MTLTLFYFFAAAMTVLLGYILLKSILNPSVRDETNHRDVNIGIARDRKSLIKDALSKGHINEETYQHELQDIETTLATELAEGPNNSQSKLMRGTGVMFILGLCIAISVLLYQRLGNTVSMQDQFLTQTGAVILPNGATVDRQIADALQAGANPRTVAQDVVNAQAQNNANGQASANSLEELLPQLEARLAENPDDAQGWALLSRTYMNMGEFAKAEQALLKVNELDDSNPEMIIMLAEARALQNEGDLTGEPKTLIERALSIDPQNQRAQLLLGLSQQQLGEHQKAIELFEGLRANPQLSEEGAANLTQMIDQSKLALSRVDANGGDADDKPGASITVAVSLSEEAAAMVSPSDSVFIFARATSGPPMPLAVRRLTVAELPISVVLDDSQAMIPNMTVSSFPSVTVSARVSPSGDAIAKSGDWFGEQTDVETRDFIASVATDSNTDSDASAPAPIEILIDRQTP